MGSENIAFFWMDVTGSNMEEVLGLLVAYFHNVLKDSIKFIEEKKKLICKDVILRYIIKIKPLYVKVSKLRFLGPLGPNKDGYVAQSIGAKKSSKGKPLSKGNSLSYRLKVVLRRLRKSRSASSTVVYVAPILRS
ncbi:hypothetical protein IEQ34_021938 [Dendrobium chrysotoxum]|uniref:Uncharacterized protein n=1 Tax=Dendrobium chrysotoxum TaxID=161865 RepID=A0AAV7FXD0_DENCH|nr:hypothetical protein IEQ34_021938 [Dendrobium chrysotoxum]